MKQLIPNKDLKKENTNDVSKPVLLSLGAMAEPLATQLQKQTFKFDKKKMDAFEKLKHAILTLLISGILPQSAADKCFEKLMKKISTHLNQENKK